MELIEKIFYRKINPSDFKQLYRIGKPKNGGGQTYIEAAGISNENIIDFLSYAEMSETSLQDDARFMYTFNAYVLGDNTKSDFIEFAPRNKRSNYKISRQYLTQKHPAWSEENGFPEPAKDDNGEYKDDFAGIIDNLIILIIRTNYRKYYAGFNDTASMPESWPKEIGLENMFQDSRKGVIDISKYKIKFNDDNQNPFGKKMENSGYQFDSDSNQIDVNTLNFNSGINSPFGHNRILFGAPGTGKSYRLTQDMIRTKDIDEDRELYEGLLVGHEKNYERVTFHPDYSYANFVGTYKPVPIEDEDGKGSITYTYVPGPFMRSYVNAIRSAQTDNPEPFLLIIEEINRANVAAVFGDIFQLLDRDENHISEYPIQVSEDMKKYLADELGGNPDEYSAIRIPDNLFIWATMNSADQGVFPIDTAFKRRWSFTYLGVDENENQIKGGNVIIGKGENAREVKWNDLRKEINNILQSFKINEDKLMGPFFISKDVMDNSEKFIRTFKNKVIMYLFDDAAKHKRTDLFKSSNPNIYSKICQEFDIKGLAIFGTEFANKFPQSVEANPSENKEDSDDTNEG